MNRGWSGNIILMILLGSLWATAAGGAEAATDSMSLAGRWRFLMGQPRESARQAALPAISFDDMIDLPATTETAAKGPVHSTGGDGQLTRVYKFEGPAWYQRDLDVPDTWRGKRVTLALERTKYSQVWLDEKLMGSSSLLCTPQEYGLGTIDPGPHRLTVVVDNSRRPLDVETHQLSDNTQGNWNGILGRIELRATDSVWLDDVQVYPHVAERSIVVKVRLGNSSQLAGVGVLNLEAKGEGISSVQKSADVNWTKDGGAAEIDLPLGKDAALWDEFHPAIHRLTVTLSGQGIADTRIVSFGLRDFAAAGQHFTINGRTTFLRGKHDACVFPLTGHPPMDVAGWVKYFAVLRTYGINHVRFHSWVPPDAAFTAADESGFYLQAELPFWGDFTEHVHKVLRPEAVAILKQLGNHPSFVMLTLGNENRFSRDIMGSMVSELRALDGRHLYAQGSNAFAWDPVLPAGDDFLVSARVKNNPKGASRNVRGSHATTDNSDGHVQIGPANTLADYSDAVAGMKGPVVGHEVGQWSVYPNFKEIAKYTGVMRAHNFEHFRDRLKDAGMLDQAADFFRASGALAAICYREDIESALRTGEMGGFQLLDLQDFPGQGTALVGMLDAFLDSKGFITPQQWQSFCAPIVLLARFGQYTWTTDQTFLAQIEIAHYGEKNLPDATIDWSIRDGDFSIASGELAAGNVRQGGLRPVGTIVASLSSAPVPRKHTLELAIRGTGIKTEYPLWVYPANQNPKVPSNVLLARNFDETAQTQLARGGRVLLVMDGTRPLLHTVGGGFTTDFWCWPMFHNKPGTMGLLCDPGHPALAGFPTEFHSDWQWFDIAAQSQPVILDGLPAGFRPIVQTIDNMERVDRLGLVFEVKSGPGSLLVCASDLIAMKDKPAANQLLQSLLSYAASEKFQPSTQVSPEQLRELFLTTLPIAGTTTASSKEGGWRKQGPEQAVDGNDFTGWHAGSRRLPQWWEIRFDAARSLSGAEILWDMDRPGYQYTIEGSKDGSHWELLSDQRHNNFKSGRQRMAFQDDDCLALRLNVMAVPSVAPACVREVRLFGARVRE
jgi:hypothetical protein